MKKALVILVGGFLLMGCNAQIKDYVRGADKRNPIQNGPDLNINGYPTVKVSPGAGKAAGTSHATHMTITPTQRVAVGNSLRTKFSFHAGRAR